MKTQEYLDAVRTSLGLPSDYALQKPLDLSKGQISNYRTGRDRLSNKVAVRVARLIKKDPVQVLIEVNMEKETDPETKAVWQSLLEKISKGFESLLLGAGPRGIRVSAC